MIVKRYFMLSPILNISTLNMKVVVEMLVMLLVSVTASTPRMGWIDVCSYSDPTGSTCCSPGMENKEYLVVTEDHDWYGHSQACRSEYFRGQHSHWS